MVNIIKEVPQSGVLIISVYWDPMEYKDNFQNDSRKKLNKTIPKIIENEGLDIDLRPLQFSLIRTVIGKKTRASGAEEHYSYRNMTLDKFKELQKLLWGARFNWWVKQKIMIGIRSEEFE